MRLLVVLGALPLLLMEEGEGASQATRAISTARLHGLRRFHLPPIDVVIFHGP
jgi:hypothetical protein